MQDHPLIGRIVRTSYGTGPYEIIGVSAPCDCPEYSRSLDGDKTPSEPHYHLECRDHPARKGIESPSYLAGYRADGSSVWTEDRLIFLSPEGIESPAYTSCYLADGTEDLRIFLPTDHANLTMSNTATPQETGNAIPPEWNEAFPEPSVGSTAPTESGRTATARHPVLVKVGQDFYPAQLSPGYEQLADWRDTPEFGRLVASALRDGRFQQSVLGKLVKGPNGHPAFEIHDGRHRWWAAERAELPHIEGAITEMAFSELAVRSLCERLHLPAGARAYLVWPLLEDQVDANKEARKRRHAENLKAINARKRKGEATESALSALSVDTTLSDLAEGEISEAVENSLVALAQMYGISKTLLVQARRVHEIFDRRHDLRVEHEPAILAGDLGMGAFLAGLAGREATAGKERKDAPPHQLLLRSFRDLKIRFAEDRWAKVAAEERNTVANEFIETLLALPEDVRSRARLALAGK